MKKRVLFCVFMGAIALAQTQVNLKLQSQNMDFTDASSTKPFRLSSVLPATCSVGEFLFLTSAPSGANIYGCIAANTWVAQAGGGSAALVFSSDGAIIGTRNVANFVTGPGLISVLTDTGTRINIQYSIDTAYVETKAGSQSGSTGLCASASASPSAFTCAMTPTLTTYSSGMVVHWEPDFSATGGSTTLNIDTLGAKAVKVADGTNDPTSADILAGRLYDLWYDGTAFRLETPPAIAALAGDRPACSAAVRGRIWQTLGMAGVKDDVSVCAKDDLDTFAWRPIY
jgi:hypothetical protein